MNKLKTYWRDSEEFWYYGGQFEVDDDNGHTVCIVPIHLDEYDDGYEEEKRRVGEIARKIVEALSGKI